MIVNIKKIYFNAQKSLYVDINGHIKKVTLSFIFIKFIVPIISGIVVYVNQDVFIDDSKIIGTLLSLFSGLMFGVLIKIPDKFKDLEPKEHESKQEILKRKQIKNYLKLFMYSLSYSILVALLSIFFVLLSSFFPSLTKLDLSNYSINLNSIDYFITLVCLATVVYRFLLVIFLINFIFFILKAVSNLYEFMLYEFSKIK